MNASVVRRGDDRMLFGTCAGVARALCIPPIVVRGALVVFVLMGTTMLIPLYLVSPVFISRRRGPRVAPILIAVGVLVLLDRLNPVSFVFGNLGLLLAVAAIAVGVSLLRRD